MFAVLALESEPVNPRLEGDDPKAELWLAKFQRIGVLVVTGSR